MDAEQLELYGETVQKWVDAVKQYGTGWDEDGPEIPVDIPLDVDMVDYRVGGLFELDIGPSSSGRELRMHRFHQFSNPVCDIMARVVRVKAHMNRMISALERNAERDIWNFVRSSVESLSYLHHGSLYRAMARTCIVQVLRAHCTGLPSSLPWEVGMGARLESPDGSSFSPEGKAEEEIHAALSEWELTYITEMKVTVFTVCPFVLHETGGRQSHTQRTHVEIGLETTAPVQMRPIIDEVTKRLVPVMSNMKIPDEVVQVLKAYSGPTFTEDGAVRVQKILRGITAEFCPEGQVRGCQVRVTSEDSHLAHDIVTTLRSDLQ